MPRLFCPEAVLRAYGLWLTCTWNPCGEQQTCPAMCGLHPTGPVTQPSSPSAVVVCLLLPAPRANGCVRIKHT